jgi:DUF1009 family protein
MTALPPLGIAAGGGAFPLRIAQAAMAGGREVFVVLVEEFANPADYQGIPHQMFRLGAIGAVLEAFRARGITQLVMAGRIKRPSMSALRPDAFGAKMLARMGTALFGGDDALMKAAIRLITEHGFEVLPVHAVLHDILPGAGPLGPLRPDAMARADIARGIAVTKALGAVDVGQGCVVQQGLVLAVEAIEGTDAMLARAGEQRREGPGGVLVKLVKPGQDRRLDLPAIGPRTVEGAIAAGLAGIAIEAYGTVVVDREPMMHLANQAGLFVVAIRPESFNPEEEIAP